MGNFRKGDIFKVTDPKIDFGDCLSQDTLYTVIGADYSEAVQSHLLKFKNDKGEAHLIAEHSVTLVRPAHCSGDPDRPEPLKFLSPVVKAPSPITSDGGSSSYYELPENAEELGDLINYRDMNFNIGNIFKACYRMGLKSGNGPEYDLNKIIFFAEMEKKRLGIK